MKKVFSIFFALILIFSLTACGAKQTQESSSDTATVSADTTINSTADNSLKQSESTTANESDTKTNTASNQPAATDSAQKTSEAGNKAEAGNETEAVSSAVKENREKLSDTETASTGTESKASQTPTKPEKKEARILIAYFSRTGNTEQIANMIHAKVGGDMFKIESKTPYSDDYNTVLNQAQKEQRSNARPELASYVDNMDGYDIVFIGYPNWWNDTPMSVLTFLERYNFSGKKVIPFCTHGGGGSGKSFSSIKTAASGADVLTGFSIQGSNASNAQSSVEKWLEGLGI